MIRREGGRVSEGGESGMKRCQDSSTFLLFVFSVLLVLPVFGSSGETTAQPIPGHADLSGNTTDEGNAGAPAKQKFYKWADDEGNLFFTDDLGRVPSRFRDRIEALEVLPPPESGDPTLEKKAPEEPVPSDKASMAVDPIEGDARRKDPGSREPYIYKEVPFDQFIHIQVGMDEAEVLSRLGFPSLITPTDYFHDKRKRYRHDIIRYIYLGNRDLNQKTTVIEIRNGRVVDIKRIFPF